VTCSDSSPYGFGVCEKSFDNATASALGRISERWRFKCEDTPKACQHALHSALRQVSFPDLAIGTWDAIPPDGVCLEDDGGVSRELSDPFDIGIPRTGGVRH